MRHETVARETHCAYDLARPMQIHYPRRHDRKDRSGFTLIELLLVIGIIAVLTSIVIIAINPTKQLAAARDADRNMRVNTLSKAASQYIIQFGPLPNINDIPVGLGSALPVCIYGMTSDPHCLNVDYLVDGFVAFNMFNPLLANATGFVAAPALVRDPYEPCEHFTGILVYQDNRVHWIAEHMNDVPGAVRECSTSSSSSSSSSSQQLQ